MSQRGPGSRGLRVDSAVVHDERVPDPAQRLRRWQGAVERQPAHSADHTPQFRV
jgi:hypothetical protein